MNTDTLPAMLVDQSTKSGNPELSLQEQPAISRSLGLQVIWAVAGGLLLGFTLRSYGSYRVPTQHLEDAGMLVIQMLKTLAVPLVFFGILDAFLRTNITLRRGAKLLRICGINVAVAFGIGLTLMNLLSPGKHVRGATQGLITKLQSSGTSGIDKLVHERPIEQLARILPEPPAVIPTVLAAILGGAALRRVRDRQSTGGDDGLLGESIRLLYDAFMQMIAWVIRLVPFAVFALITHLVNRSGFEPFKALWALLAVVLIGMAIHALVYYPAAAWLCAGMSPRTFLTKGSDAVVMGLSTNSSLATVPVTLSCLTEKMGVSNESARLSACMGTNLNNDGITLYEAMAALFLAQACGFELSLGQQVVVIVASLMAGIGIGGVPEAGLIALPLVLGAAGLPEGVIAAALPLLMSVDWILARARSAVNVLSDMMVAVLLDGKVHRATVS